MSARLADEPVVVSPADAEPAQAAGVRRYRRLAVILLVAAVGIGAAWWTTDRDAGLVNVARTPVESPWPPRLAGVPIGHDVVDEQQITYASDMRRSWESADGLHHVTVVTGTLSVEDEYGFRRDYGAGHSYMAGWSAYVTANRTAHPVVVTVQALRPSADARNGPAPND